MTKRLIFRMLLVLVAVSLFTGCSSRSKKRDFTGSVPDGMDPGFPGGWENPVLGSRPTMSDLGTLVDVQFENVFFDFDRARVAESERTKVELVADYMRGNPTVIIVVEGHCDARGSRDYNMALGERRALAVRAYLIGLGIDGARIHTKSYGEEMPVDPGHSEKTWRLNRRVEFVVYEP